jgi:hypothetical protein
MLRKFSYTYDPFLGGPILGNSAELSVDEIENAGLVEVLQTPGVPLGSWAFLNTLLAPTGSGSPFVFKRPLGEAREVKVALSGLFGRFVARAYLERYFKLSIFAHLGRPTVWLDRRMRLRIKRKKGRRGDFPDWIASDASLKRLFVAEAKGCHDISGPGQALARAWAQANRIDIIRRRKRVDQKANLKRIAIATRWGVATGGPADPIMAVKDPDETGDTPDEMSAALVGIARRHTANLVRGLGYGSLAHALGELIDAPRREVSGAQQTALRVLAEAHASTPTEAQLVGPTDALIGRWVTRAGFAGGADLSSSDREVLRRLDLGPVFVGVEREFVRAVINGELDLIRNRVRERVTTGTARTNGVGVWMLHPPVTD